MCRKKAAQYKGREWIAGRKEEFIKTQRERKELKRERKEKKRCCQVQTEGIGLHWGEKVQYML